jgi:hypothetical protein
VLRQRNARIDLPQSAGHGLRAAREFAQGPELKEVGTPGGNRPERRGGRPMPENHAGQRLEREREELTLNFASWNQLDSWLRQIESLRLAA